MKKIKIPYVEILNKKTKEIMEQPAKDFLNPKNKKDEFPEIVELSPSTFYQSYKMLIDFLSGEMYQNTHFAVRLKGVLHKWNW